MVFGGITKALSDVVQVATDPLISVGKSGLPQAAGKAFIASKAAGAFQGSTYFPSIKPIDGTKVNTMANDNGFFGSFFTDLGRGLGTIGEGLGGFVRGVESVERPLARFGTQLLPEAPTSYGTNVAADVYRSGGQETAGSSSMGYQAYALPALPSLTAPLIGAGRQLLSKPATQFGLGLGASELFDFATAPSAPKMRITRKMKAEIRRLYMLSGGDAATTAQIYQQLTGMPMTAQGVLMILLKRFRNDGPVITKAAMRKTKQTLRRMKSMCDMYDDVTKRPAARRAPARRRSSTSVVNVK